MLFGLSQIRLIAYAAAALAFVGVVVALKVQTARLDATKQEYAGFVAKVKAEGEAAQAKAWAKEAEDKSLKARIDNEHEQLKSRLADTTRDLRAATDRVRSAGSSSRELPRPTTPANRPDLFCVERAEYEREDRIAGARFRESVAAILAGSRSVADEGDACALSLQAAREWARGYAGGQLK